MPESKDHNARTLVAPAWRHRVDPGELAKGCATLLSWLAIAVSVAALSEYAFGVPLLERLVPGLMGMSFLTAIALLTLGLSTLSSRYLSMAWALTLLCGAIAVAVLMSHLAAGSDVLSVSAVAGLKPGSTVPPGRMSPATATCLAVLALARIAHLLNRHKACDVLALLGLCIAGIGLLGYAYGVRDHYTVSVFNTMALHTALALICLALSMMLRQAEHGWLSVVTMSNRAGALTRRQLVLTGLLPFVGWLLLLAVDRSLIGPPAALALVVGSVFLPLVILVIREGRVTARLDRQRHEQHRLEHMIRQRLELELSAKRAELELESAQRIAAEQAMNRAQRLEAVGQLTGGIAHDFNNLLMGISGNLELLQRQVEGNAKAMKYVERAALSTHKGIRLTGQLLAFSRTQRLNIADVDLAETMSAAVELVGNALGPHINIEMRPPQAGLLASTDPLQLEMAILNLALNARDAMPDGGWFTVVCAPAQASDKGPMVSIKVSDTGSGMAPEVLAKACEPFFTTKAAGRGTGLGLAQVYGLCRQCGGDLKITSEQGKGSTFELLLPAGTASPHIPALPTLKPVEGPMTRPAHPLLVVDDDDAVRCVLVDDLRARGYEVLEVDRGSKALSLLDNTPCAVAIIDFLMPEMNGADVARQARLIVPTLPIIFISGYSDTLALDAISGAVVLRKPFEMARLDELIREMTL
jgi:signal transduction histidine kinase